MIWLAGCATMESRYKAATTEGTVQAYEEFLKNYPNESLSGQARNQLQACLLRDAESAGTVETYEAFLNRFPEGEYAAKAQAGLQSICFKEAESVNTVGAFESFLNRFTEGDHVEPARTRMRALYWREAETANTVSGYQAFLTRFPEGEYVDNAKEKLQAILLDIELLSSHACTGRNPIKALSSTHEKDMYALVQSPNIPNDILGGTTEFENKRGFVDIPKQYTPVIVRVGINSKGETRVKACDFSLVDANNNKYRGTFWDDDLRSWVCVEADYQTGRYKEHLIFFVPESAAKQELELWLGEGKRVGKKKPAVTCRHHSNFHAEVSDGAIVKKSELGEVLLYVNGKAVYLGGFGIKASGWTTTTVKPKKAS